MEYFAPLRLQLRLIRADFIAEHNVMNLVSLRICMEADIRRNLLGSADFEDAEMRSILVTFIALIHHLTRHLINQSIAMLKPNFTGKAIHQHFQPTGLIFSARYNLQIFRISRRRCLAEQLNFSNSLQQE